MREIGFICCMLLAAFLPASAEDSNLMVLEGTFFQTTEYIYRVTLEPDGRTLDANIGLLDPVDQPWYRVTIHEQSVTADTEWSSRYDQTDTSGNRTAKLSWADVPGEVVVERYVRAASEAIYGPILLPDLFPIPAGTLPWFCYDALVPTNQYQSTDPTLRAYAEGLTDSSPTQLDAVVRVLSWIRREVEYACSRELCDPVYRTDALFTMEKKKGNCVSYANLAIALLRAAGIPTMPASGFVADRAESSACHAWIAVYFPSSGWIEFEPADWMPTYREAPVTFLMPQHLTIRTGNTMEGISRAPFSEHHEAEFEIVERPEPKTSVMGNATAGQAIAWVITVESPTYEDAQLQLSIMTAPGGWQVVLSEMEIFIGENDVSRSVDVLVTVIPSDGAIPGDLGQVVVICTHGGAEVGRVAFDVSIFLPLSLESMAVSKSSSDCKCTRPEAQVLRES